jgi:hypothetical protein
MPGMRVATVLVLSACASVPEAGDHSNQRRGSAAPPVLPSVQSQRLERLPYGSMFMRAAPRASTGAPASGVVSGLVPGNRRIVQRVLLLGATGAEPAYLHARSALDRIGVPYTSLIAADEDLTASMLTDNATTCYYSAVIIATSSLGYRDPATGTWQSALTQPEWQTLADFEAACSAREVTWYGWPGSEFGLAPVAPFDATTAVDGRLTASGRAVFEHVRGDARVPIRQSYGYRAVIDDPASTRSLIETFDGSVLVALHTAPDGREALVSMVDSSPYLAHGLLLEYDLIRWVTRDLFVGKKRAYLSPQIDDLFIADDLWIIGQGDTGGSQLRITGADLTALATWQADRIAKLPAGSTFATSLAYNGAGTVAADYPDTSLVAAAVGGAGRAMLWVSHTWDHENMDAMSFTAAREEVTRNCRVGRSLRLRGLDCTELVTPDMSGLANPAAVAGMLAAGVTNVVSDTSHTAASFPNSPGDNPSSNVGRPNLIDPRLYQIPRHPTSIFYNTVDPATQTDEYNVLYRSYYGRELTYREMLDKDSALGLLYLLQGDIDPLMFHQPNLVRFTNDRGETRSLYADWIDTVLDKFLALSNVPVLTLTQAATARAMQARDALNRCGVVATKVESAKATTLELLTFGACTVPVTGLRAPAAGAVEIYAGQPTTSIAMPARGIRTIPLD